jgi:hypothetical protein
MKLITALLLTVVAFPVLADRVVNGYVKRDGTVVQPHVKTESNRTRSDNYSTQGNKNPYTARTGRPPSRKQPRHGFVPSLTAAASCPAAAAPLRRPAIKAARQLAACRRLPRRHLNRAVTR